MTATYNPFAGDFGAYGSSTEHPWFSWDQPLTVNPGTTSPTTSGGFLGSGFPQGGGFLNAQFNPMSFQGMDFNQPGGPGAPGQGVSGNNTGPTAGVATGTPGSQVGQAAADAIAAAMSAVGVPSLSMAPAIANMLGLASSVNQPGIATVDVNEPNPNINDVMAAIDSQSQAAANDPSVSPVGIGIGPSPNPGTGPTSSSNDGPGNSSDSEGGGNKRGGFIRHSDKGGPARDRFRAAPMSSNVLDMRHLPAEADYSDMPLTREGVEEEMRRLRDNEEMDRLRRAGPTSMPESDVMHELSQLLGRRRGGAMRQMAEGGPSDDDGPSVPIGRGRLGLSAEKSGDFPFELGLRYTHPVGRGEMSMEVARDTMAKEMYGRERPRVQIRGRIPFRNGGHLRASNG